MDLPTQKYQIVNSWGRYGKYCKDKVIGISPTYVQLSNHDLNIVYGYETQTDASPYSNPASPHIGREASRPIAPSMGFMIVMITPIMNRDQKLY